MLRRLGFISLCFVVVAGGFSCSKKKTTDTAVENTPTEQTTTPTTAQVDSTPLSFAAAGSDSGKIQGLNTVQFEYDKSTLSAEARKTLQGNAEWMKNNAKMKVQIEGHCDSRGSLEYNLALGERRANSVKAYMNSLGIPNSRLSVISFGEQKPLVDGETEEAYSKNRRANFVPAQ